MHINIMYAADENYAPFLGVSLFSLLENNKDIEEITVYTVLDRVSQKNKNRIDKMMEDYSREWICIDADDFNSRLAKLGVPKYRGSYTTHFRELFHLIIKDDVEKLLYIDSDTIVPGSLRELFAMDMGDACVGVVRDALAVKYKLLLGFGPEDVYFNAGVTFIDVVNWEKNRCTETLLDHIQNVRAQYCNPDQDLFNIVLKGKLKVLPCNYNFMPAHRAYSDKAYAKCFGFDNYYSQEEIEDARRNPIIIHAYRFIGEFPWHKNNYHPDTQLFDEYLAKSPWSDYIKKPANTGFVLKAEKALFKMLPNDMFLPIFSRVMYYTFKRKNDKLSKE